MRMLFLRSHFFSLNSVPEAFQRACKEAHSPYILQQEDASNGTLTRRLLLNLKWESRRIVTSLETDLDH